MLRFDVLSSYVDNFEVHTVGDSRHKEYWIPGADLQEFNRNIVGPICVLVTYRCQGNAGEVRVFDLGDSGSSDVGNNKDAIIGDSFEQARGKRRRRCTFLDICCS